MNAYSYIVNVEAAILKDDTWLLAKRSTTEEHAAGAIAMIGGKVEGLDILDDVLEKNLKREIKEEVGITVLDELRYVRSCVFITDDGRPVVDIVFLCYHQEGEPAILDTTELSSIEWLTYQEIEDHNEIPPWTKESLRIAESLRLEKALL